jgi:NADH-quinone oxidoreductase subunit N
MGVVFVLVGFAFKVSAVPFHFWAPDTYQGAPTPVAAYLSVGSKAAGFVGLLVICYQAFAAVPEIWGPILWVLAAASMTIGNLGALKQTNIVRLLGTRRSHGGSSWCHSPAASYDSVGLADAFWSSPISDLRLHEPGAFALVIVGSAGQVGRMRTGRG